MKNIKRYLVVLAVAIIAMCAALIMPKDLVIAETYHSPYSTSNAPIFYGAVEVTMDKNVVNIFDPKDSRWRIFAKDFEDGDVSQNIQCYYNDVDPTTAGAYEIKYRITDSHNNTNEITVPVHITDDSSGQISIIRRVYAVPALSNLAKVGTNRCNLGDRQILGVYMPAGTTIKLKLIDWDYSLLSDNHRTEITHISNTRVKNCFLYFDKNTKDYVEIKNTKSTEYCGVPVITSPVLKEDNVIDKTYDIEIVYDSSIKPLDYYHYLDDEDNFKSEWKKSGNEYGVVDCEAIMCVVPATDIDQIGKTSTQANAFSSLDEFCEYYTEVVNRYDKMLGLEFDSDSLINQNYRTKYLFIADGSYAGSIGAYYANGGLIAAASYSLAAGFTYGWGTLHEIAHGYQGALGSGNNSKGLLYLGETGNNILAHYIQMDRTLYKKPGYNLGLLKDIENGYNNTRYKQINNNVKIFGDNGNDIEKLYFVINLLDHFEGSQTYAKLFRYYRALAYDKGTDAYSIADVYTRFFAEEYSVNIIPYLSAWTIDVSNATKDYILNKGLEELTIAADLMAEENLNQIMEKENLDLKYGLVSEKTIDKYNLIGNLTIHLNDTDYAKIAGRYLAIAKQNKIIQTIKITSKDVNVKNVPIGSIEIKMPLLKDCDNLIAYCTIKSGDNELSYTYKEHSSIDYGATEIKLYGVYGTIGYSLAMSNHYTTGKITYGAAYLGNNGNDQDTIYASVKITDPNGNIIDNIEVKGAGYFAASATSKDVSLGIGYKISIFYKRPELIKVIASLNNTVMPEYAITDSNTINYVITTYGLKLLNVSNFDEQKVIYNATKETLHSIINNYKNDVSEDSLTNRRIDWNTKLLMLDVFEYFPDDDTSEFIDLINKIKLGSAPTIIASDYSINMGDSVSYSDNIKITDIEDYVIDLDSDNVNIVGTVNNKRSGKYKVTISATDIDGNTATKTITITVINNKLNITLAIWIPIAAVLIILLGGMFVYINKHKHK